MSALATIPFQFDVKGITDAPVELENGALLISGTGANFQWDREGERFVEGSFTRGLRSFLAGSAPLLFHHKPDHVIGRVLSADPVPGGIRVKAIVDPQPVSSPLRWIYEGIKRGRIASFSVGGKFTRRQTKSGPEIVDVDIFEWSATPISIGKGTDFSVIAGKALYAPDGKAVTADGDLSDVRANLARLEHETAIMRAAYTDLSAANFAADVNAYVA